MGLSINGPPMKRVLEKHGWHVERETGHWQMTHPDIPGRVISVSRHRDDIKKKALLEILRSAGLTEDEVRRAM